MRLTIHRDGRLVVHEHGEPDREIERNDPLALAAAFRAVVELEEGLTSAQLFRAFAPWTALLSRTAWIDFGRWLDAACCAPLSLVGAEPVSESCAEPPLDAVIVHPVMIVHRERAPSVPSLTLDIRWQTSGRYATPRPDGFGHEDRFCSLSLSPPSEWAHLPLIIDCSMKIDDLNIPAPDDVSLQLFQDAPLRAEPTLFESLILGFLDDVSFHGTPADAVTARDDLLAQVDAARAAAERGELLTLEEFQKSLPESFAKPDDERNE